MKKVLGILLHPVVLAIVGLLAAALLIWLVGPLVSIGTFTPLASGTARWITIGVLVALVALKMAWRAWRARRRNGQVVSQLVAQGAAGGAGRKGAAAEAPEIAQLRGRFEAAMQTLKEARLGRKTGFWASLSSRFGRQYLYELPWYVIVGAPGAGKTTALLNSGLQFPLAEKLGRGAVKGVGGTRNCDWWFTDRAVLIDTAGRYTTHEADPQGDRSAWQGFLALLKKARPRRPINGILMTVSATDLLGFTGEQRTAHATLLRSRIQELHAALGIRFPVYVLVTKCDLLAGFMDYFADTGKEERAQIWGSTFDYALSIQGKAAEGFAPAFDQLTARLLAATIDRMQQERDPQRRARIYAFPQQFGGLRDALDDLLKTSFEGSQYDTAPCLRGVYFASGTQEGTPIDRMLGAISRELKLERLVLPPNQNSGRSFFLSKLLDDVVFREAELAGSDLKWERRRSLLAWATYALLGVVAVLCIGAWITSFLGNRAYVAQVAETAEAGRRIVEATPREATPDLVPLLPALNALRELAGTTQGKQAPWTLGFGLFQGPKLEAAARQAYDRMLLDALLPRLSLRIEQQMRTGGDRPEAQYEALKVYVMLHDARRFDPEAFKGFVQFDWNGTLDGVLAPDQRAQLDAHLDALLAAGAAGGQVAEDRALLQAVRAQLANVPLAQRVYTRLQTDRRANEFPEFTVAKAGGSAAALVFVRASGQPITRGVPGRFSYDGYYKGFQKNVAVVTAQLAEEESWVLGVTDGGAARWRDPAAVARLTDDVRRLFLTDYARTWEAFVADVKVKRGADLRENIQIARILSAPDNPLVPLTRAMVRETTLLAGDDRTAVEKGIDKGTEVLKQQRERLEDLFGRKPAGQAIEAVGRPESIVDDRFKALRDFAKAPNPGDKAPVDASVALLNDVYVALSAMQTAVAAGNVPPPDPALQRVRNECERFPEPARSMLCALAASGVAAAGSRTRETLAGLVKSQLGDACRESIAGRYPFNRTATRDVTQDDFANFFAPGGRFDDFFQKNLVQFVDTATKPWTFKSMADLPLGRDSATLAQFQNAGIIRDTFFRAGGRQPALRLEFKPVEMDPSITQFLLDVDGQAVRYAHGPQIPAAVQWPGPRGSTQVRVQLSPTTAGASGAVAEGPWALFRLFDRMQMEPAGAPERFRVTFNVDGRRAIFEVTANSVQNPFRLRELERFNCPVGL